MPSPRQNKRKGVETENSGVEHLRENGVPNAERRRLTGRYDQGDVAGWSAPDGSKRVCVEIKSGATLKLNEWLRELDEEITNSRSEAGFVWVRPKGKPRPEDWFVVMRTDMVMHLLKEAGFIHV